MGIKYKNTSNEWVEIVGIPGEDGKTPVKGTDYYTEADKQEMVELVIAALPTVEGAEF